MQLVSSMILACALVNLSAWCKQATTPHNAGMPPKLLARIHAKEMKKVCAPVDVKQSAKRQQQCNCVPHGRIVAGHMFCDQAVPSWQCPHELIQSVEPQPYDTSP